MPASMTSPSTTSPRLIHGLARLMRGLLWLLLGGVLLVALAWGGLHVWIVPRIAEFAPRLEAMTSRALGVPVRIGALRAHSSGWMPALELTDVRLLDAQQREALRLPRVLATLSVSALLRLDFEQLYIEQPELEIRRTKEGRLLVAGLDLAAQPQQDHASATDWFFSQNEFAIRHGVLRWVDELRDAPALELRDVDLVLRNRRLGHDLRIDATPPAGWGQRFSVMGQFSQPLLSLHAGRWQDWDGQLYAHFVQVDVSQLRRHLPGSSEIRQGNGALRVWLDVRQGQLIGGVADLALREVSAILQPGLDLLALDNVQGRLLARNDETGFRFETQGLQFRTRSGLQWPGGNLMVTQHADSAGRPAGGELQTGELDLAALRQIANSLPLGAAANDLLKKHPFEGRVKTLHATWQGELAAPQAYSLQGRIEKLVIAARALPQPAAALPSAAVPNAAVPNAAVPNAAVTNAAAPSVAVTNPAAPNAAPRAPTHTPSHAIPQPGVPGLRGADVDVSLTQAGGTAKIAIRNGALEFPGVFEDPLIAFERFDADVQWRIAGEHIDVGPITARFANADLTGDVQGAWRTLPNPAPGQSRFPGIMELQGLLTQANGARVHRYLPLVLPADVRHYVRDAVQQGKLRQVAVNIRGELEKIPYDNPADGEFHFAGQLSEAVYAYAPPSILPAGQPPWPALVGLSGELVFDRNSMQVKNASGKLAGAPGLALTQVQARIPHFVKAPIVEVSANAKGPLAEMLAVVKTSPLQGMTSKALAEATGGGNADLQLRLKLPIEHIDTATVDGEVQLAGNELQVTPDTPRLTQARGSVAFSEGGFALKGVQARMLGGDVRLEGDMKGGGDAPVAIKAQGTATAEGLRQARELGAVAQLAQQASGATAYTATLGFRQGHAEVAVSSTLQGLAINLPAPLSKAAESVLPLKIENTLLREGPVVRATPARSGAAPALQDQWRVDLGTLAQARYVRDQSGPQPRVLRGRLLLGLDMAAATVMPLPAEGVAAHVQLPQLDADAWSRVLARLGAAPTQASSANPSRAWLPYLPTRLALRVGHLKAGGYQIDNVLLSGSREGPLWRGNLHSTQARGYLEYRQPVGAGEGRVFGRLTQLRLDPAETRGVETLLQDQTHSIPALDLVVDDFVLRGLSLGRLELEAVNRSPGTVQREGGVREWRLSKLRLMTPEATLNATGNWAALNAQALPPGARARGADETRRTVLNFRLEMADAGALTHRLGLKNVFRRGKGAIEGQLGWVGSPLSPHVPSLDGQLALHLEKGQFLKADPGAARLLGVLSLQSLPRRLALDFRDVFSDGFVFDVIRGDVGVSQGVASTNNLQMTGVNAAVMMEGHASVVDETQNLRVVVVPEINAGTASLAAAVIHPLVGLSSFLAQWFLRKPMMEMATQEFRIEGAWSDPKVIKVERRRSAPPASSREQDPSPAPGTPASTAAPEVLPTPLPAPATRAQPAPALPAPSSTPSLRSRKP